MRRITYISLIIICIFLVGCGETIRGVGKDVSRVGKGVKTIFTREGAE